MGPYKYPQLAWYLPEYFSPVELIACKDTQAAIGRFALAVRFGAIWCAVRCPDTQSNGERMGGHLWGTAGHGFVERWCDLMAVE